MKLLFDLFPLLIFFGAFKFYGIYAATAAAIIATFIQVGLFWQKHRRFETMHLVTLVIISFFGGLTILLQDDVFIKWKPSIVNWIFALIIFWTLIFGKKTALEHLMGSQLELPGPVWVRVNVAWAIFFTLMGLLNLYVAFYYNLDANEEIRTDTWVNFKVFGMFGLTLIFSFAQIFYLSKHLNLEEDKP